MTRISSSSWKRSTISFIARCTIGPIVSASLRVGRTRLTVVPCLALSAVSRARSPNSEWWKFDSPNQRSTRAGTARTSSAARSAAASVSAREASWSNVALAICSRVLTTMTVGFARAAIDSGSAPNRYGSPSAPNGWAEAPITTRSAFSASRRIAARTFGASRRIASPSALQVLLHERGQRVLGLGADGRRDPRRDEVEDRHRRPVRLGDRVGETDRELGVWPAADRHEDPPDRRSAALLDDRDVARRVAHDLVDRRREHGRAVAVASVRRLAAPAEDHEVRLLLAGCLDDALGRAPADAHDRLNRRSLGREVEDTLEEPTSVPRPRRAL